MAAVPEMRLLTECLPATARTPTEQEAPSEALDWSRLVMLAGWHGMVPLLSARLFGAGGWATSGRQADLQAAPALSRLKTSQAAYVGWTVTHLAALVELQREFDRDGLRVVPWKGPTAGLLLYPSATLRESADLDFLFLEEDRERIFLITGRLGYQLLGASASESKDIYILTQKREFTFARVADQVVLEFHLQMMPARFALWQDSRADILRAETRCQLGGVTLLLQRPEDMLVSLCAHATKHNWERLKWTADIAQFLKTYGDRLDWVQLMEQLARAKKHFVVLMGLAMAETIYGTALPAAVTQWHMRTPKILELSDRVTAHMMSGTIETAAEEDRKAFATLLCPRWRDRVVYNLTPLVELNYEDLYIPVHHRKLFFMNYFFRVFRLLRKYGPQRLATKTAGSVRSVH